MDGERAHPRLDPTWLAAVGDEFDRPYMAALKAFLRAEIAAGKEIYPPPPLFFAALDRTPLPSVKAVILGQDPYHGPGQAHGLSFSVPRGVPKPSSLRNVVREAAEDVGMPEPTHGCLEAWADRGVLLLNTSLSVERGLPGSHADKGWAGLTDRIISAVNERPGHVAFVLWGRHAQSKIPLIDAGRHLVHRSVHPSGLSAHRGFFGSRPFTAVNRFLEGRGIAPIDWTLG